MISKRLKQAAIVSTITIGAITGISVGIRKWYESIDKSLQDKYKEHIDRLVADIHHLLHENEEIEQELGYTKLDKDTLEERVKKLEKRNEELRKRNEELNYTRDEALADVGYLKDTLAETRRERDYALDYNYIDKVRWFAELNDLENSHITIFNRTQHNKDTFMKFIQERLDKINSYSFNDSDYTRARKALNFRIEYLIIGMESCRQEPHRYDKRVTLYLEEIRTQIARFEHILDDYFDGYVCDCRLNEYLDEFHGDMWDPSENWANYVILDDIPLAQQGNDLYELFYGELQEDSQESSQ